MPLVYLFTAGVPSLMTPQAAEAEIACHTRAGVASGSVARKSAAAPATRPTACEVPLRVSRAVLSCFEAPKMLCPGAKMSTHEPKLLPVPLSTCRRVSSSLVAATVMEVGSRDGDVRQASVALLPAAAMTVTPVATSLQCGIAVCVTNVQMSGRQHHRVNPV